jgi:hypothetical protein
LTYSISRRSVFQVEGVVPTNNYTVPYIINLTNADSSSFILINGVLDGASLGDLAIVTSDMSETFKDFNFTCLGREECY